METKQTAVDWLYERLERMIPRTALYNIDKKIYFDKAKQMEREQIKEAYIAGDQGYYRLEEIKEFAKDYYIEIYGGQDE
jgi:hypothetical protein